MGFIKALLLLVIIPIGGFFVADWALLALSTERLGSNSDYANHTLHQLCNASTVLQTADLNIICAKASPILWMKIAAIISAILAILLLLSFVVFAARAGKNRAKIARIFPPLTLMTLIVLSVLVTIQGVILTYSIYLIELYAYHSTSPFIIGLIGFLVFISGVKLIEAAFQFSKKQTHFILGEKIALEDHPNLFALINEVTDILGARHPEHIVVGLEPNFYVTSADVQIPGEEDSPVVTLKGETLYLSLPLTRTLTEEELKGIIAHELGHFRGEDTLYSLKFSPAYSGLFHAINAMDSGFSLVSIITLPAFTTLSYMLAVFDTNISSINRKREYEADRVASEVVNAEALVSALLKIGLYTHAWHHLENNVIQRLQVGKVTRNLSRLFSSAAKYDLVDDAIPKLIESTATETIAHPTDSHPPTAKRIAKLGVNIDDIGHELLALPKKSCVTLFENPITIEESLTFAQQQYYFVLGVPIPDEDMSDGWAIIIAALGARMVLADGVVKAEEVDKAESLGISLNPYFDYIEFREFCFYPDSIPLLEDLLEASQEVPDDEKAMLLHYLEQIADSDNNLNPDEEQLLEHIALSFKLPRELVTP